MSSPSQLALAGAKPTLDLCSGKASTGASGQGVGEWPGGVAVLVRPAERDRPSRVAVVIVDG